MHRNFETLIYRLVDCELLLYGVLSSPVLKTGLVKKVEIRPIKNKRGLFFQVTEFKGSQAFHQNLTKEQICEYIKEKISRDYKTSLLCSVEADYQFLLNRNKEVKILKKPSTHQPQLERHNRPKNYFFEEGNPVPFLIELGIMSKEGKVYPKKYHKFKQINRFIEFIDDVSDKLDKTKKINVIDFGSGKSYLTFALYYYLLKKKFTFSIEGLDLKKEVIEECQALSVKLGCHNLNFSVGSIQDYSPSHPIDMVVSLHACDTATDAVIAQAVKWEANILLCVPCCQHELLNQIEQPLLSPLLKHGILKERFSALVTDAIRGQLLELKGYKTQILEFIDMEHTPKNLLIRAVKQRLSMHPHSLSEEYLKFKTFLNIQPLLQNLLKL